MKAASWIAAVVCALLAAALALRMGLFDIAATAQHSQPVYTLLETTMHWSVRQRARGIVEPDLSASSLLLRGAACYRDRCVQCHGAPGVAPAEIGRGMQPLPGPLMDVNGKWRSRELYWITRHGIKMSGMPAWQYRLDEAEIWAVVAFVQALPRLSAPAYAQTLERVAGVACPARSEPPDPPAPDARRGRAALQQHACSACHVIPGLSGSDVHVGPPLAGLGSRGLIAGTLANTPDNLVRWIVDPSSVDPETAMPALGVTEADARDMAAYLATLR